MDGVVPIGMCSRSLAGSAISPHFYANKDIWGADDTAVWQDRIGLELWCVVQELSKRGGEARWMAGSARVTPLVAWRGTAKRPKWDSQSMGSEAESRAVRLRNNCLSDGLSSFMQAVETAKPTGAT